MQSTAAQRQRSSPLAWEKNSKTTTSQPKHSNVLFCVAADLVTCAREATPYSEAPAPAPGPAPAAEPSVAPPSISTSFGLVSVKLILKSNEMSLGKTGSVTANDSPDAIKLEIGFSRFGLPFIALGHRTLRVGFTPAARTHRVAARKASGLGSHTLSAGVDSVGSLSCLQGWSDIAKPSPTPTPQSTTYKSIASFNWSMTSCTVVVAGRSHTRLGMLHAQQLSLRWYSKVYEYVPSPPEYLCTVVVRMGGMTPRTRAKEQHHHVLEIVVEALRGVAHQFEGLIDAGSGDESVR